MSQGLFQMQRADKSSALAESRATCCLRSAKPMCLNILIKCMTHYVFQRNFKQVSLRYKI